MHWKKAKWCRLILNLIFRWQISPRKRTAENSPAIQRPCQTSEILENGPLKSFAVIEKRLTGQISPKIFSGSFFIRVLTQPLHRWERDANLENKSAKRTTESASARITRIWQHRNGLSDCWAQSPEGRV